MEIRLALASLLICFFTGCNTHPIPETYRPLTEIAQRAWPGSYITTIHTSVWVEDIETYLSTKPEGSTLYVGNMIHERIHSIRMGGWFGTFLFIMKYAFSTEFMWEEERICWYYELMYLRSKGVERHPMYTASFLASGYENILGSMISPEDALRWVQDVLDGKWKPDVTPKEEELYYTSILKKLDDG